MEEEKHDVKGSFLKENIANALCYLFFWIGGVIFLIMKKDNRSVRFHAMQSIVVFGMVTIIYFIIGVIDRVIIYTSAWNYRGFFIFINILDIFTAALSFLVFLLWLFLIIISLQGENVKLPYFGKIVDSII